MEGLKQKIMRFRDWIKSPRGKKSLYVGLVVVLAGWVLFRFAVIGAQNRLQIFNPARDMASRGVPVQVLQLHSAPGVVREPLTVKINRAYVSGARAGLLRPGQKVGDGEIVSVSSNIDLDTGMHVVRTRGVADGLQYALFRTTGHFIPVYAINNGAVFVVRDGLAVRTPVTVSRQDADLAYVTAGVVDGDIVVLSRIQDGAKVRVIK